MERYEMMGDLSTTDTTVLELPRPGRDTFFLNSPMAAHEPSAPSSSTDLHSRAPPYHQLDHHPAAPFRYNGSEEWRNRASQPAFESLIGHSNGTADTVDLMTSAGVGEDDLFTYPRGEADAVTITARDLEGLQPGKFVSDNIIDFYVKYLKLKILSRDLVKQQRVHFFNSFIFTKFLESIRLGNRFLRTVSDSEQLQRWIGDVNLFEKDHIFIPVVRRSHWSLIVICHLGRLVSNTLGEEGSPCILHLDPMEGKHECFEDEVKGFLHHASLKTFHGVYHEDVSSTLNTMKYVQAEVPQQGNDYDCGMYILHYIEVFLSKWTSGDPSFPFCQGGDQFTNPHFGMEVWEKRSQIRSLILELSGRTQELDINPSSFQEIPQVDVRVVQQLRPQRKCSKSRAKVTKSKKCTEEETSVLLRCMLDVCRFGIKNKRGAMRWDLISQEMNKCNGGRSRSNEFCRRRFDTLLKAYKALNDFCEEKNKTFGEITDAENTSMGLSTPLTEAWFNDIRAICSQRASLKGKAAKRQKLKCDGSIDINRPESSHDLDLAVQRPMPSEPTGSVHPKKAASKQVAIPGFGALDIELKCTLLNMIQAGERTCNLEEICRMLAIVQEQNPLEICKRVYELRDLGLVNLVGCPQMIKYLDEWKDYQWISLTRLKAFKKFGEKVLRKNPHLRTFWRATGGDYFAPTLFPSQQIRVLKLFRCQELKQLNLGDFPELRCLQIFLCEKLESIGGWEAVKELGSIEISDCDRYRETPGVQWLSSLREFTFEQVVNKPNGMQFTDFSKCMPLRSLRIDNDWFMEESMKLESLKFLEILTLTHCLGLSTIRGLRGLHALAELDLRGCKNLEKVPELGCLKALTHLNMCGSGIVDIEGVETLRLLTSLDISYCRSLKNLPFLGDLKALAYFDLEWSGIREIPGVQNLINLKILDCFYSRLSRLPNLQHLPHLLWVNIKRTPLSYTMDLSEEMDLPNSSWWKNSWIHPSRDKGIIAVDDVSDVSDTSDVSFSASSSDED